MNASRRPAFGAGVIAASLIVVGAAGVAAQSPEPMAESATVRVLHASPDAPAVDVYANGAEILSDVPFGGISEYLEVPAGEYQIQVFPASPDPATDGAVIDALLTFEAGTMTTVAATNNVASIEAQVIADAPAPVVDQAQIRVVHLSADAPAVDIAPDGAEPIVSNLAYPTATDYLTVPAGAYDLEVRPTGTLDVALQLDPLVLEAGKSYSAFAIGSLAGGTLQVLPQVDAVNELTTEASPAPSPAEVVAAPDTALGAITRALVEVPGGAVVDLERDREGVRRVWAVVVRPESGRGVELKLARGDGSLVRRELTSVPALARTGAPAVSAADAVDIALTAVPGGEVVDFQLEREMRRTIWEVRVNGTTRRGVEVWIDASNGEVLRQGRPS